MSASAKSAPIHTIELEFVKIEIYDQYLVSTIAHGVYFDLQQLAIMVDIFRKYFKDKPFISIANRTNDYTINPTCYQQNIDLPNLLGIVVVCYSEASFKTAEFERKFYKKTYEICKSIDEAMEWSTNLIETKNKAGL